ncbi:GIY-YIG nuclease family protein [Vampirovibrio chlorellavorus]|uniref:GIY-YIG nuclease family protein n=1 Tax=Vampirovibrio chlorellavorus TaxID=758823 RepID=UPI0026EC6866|nr:GIY-YIG nuclease family protein [Vampirovibrio chlorellavorus]
MSCYSDYHGWFPLKDEEIKKRITRTEPGTYVLGVVNAGAFIHKYIGRSDNDLQRRLSEHVEVKYSHFYYKQFDSVISTFLEECTLYHELDGLDNENHPAKPRDIDVKCLFGECNFSRQSSP